MSISNHCLPPSSSLPPVRQLRSATKDQILTALHNLQAIYCPLRLPTILPKDKQSQSTYVDSGYVSEDDEVASDDVSGAEDSLIALRTNEFERAFAVRWLTSLISRTEDLPFDEDERLNIADEASFILSSFSDPGDTVDDALPRDFSFSTSLSSDPITISLNDAPLSGTDHTDVGLQSWGASIIFSSLLCASPQRFGLDRLPFDASIIELGAGTGLISLTLAKLVPFLPAIEPSITATDYHPAVLDNLQVNIMTSFPTTSPSSLPLKTMFLDWSVPPSSLRSSVHILFAADVVYASEHAAWLRDCAAHLLAPDGTFWLMVTVRSSGKFEGIPDTAEAAFERSVCPRNENGRLLKILEKETLTKERGIGRGDEVGYMLFKIGWA